MILFAEDWERSNAVADIHTTNRSFVHMARLLKTMGIKNHMFFLALLDKRCKEINPFSPNISQEEIAILAQEMYLNPWYFFREIARAPGQSGSAARMLEANRGNMATFWLFFNHVLQMLIQIRQTGKSFNSDILATYLMQVACRDTQINLLTKDEKLRRANIQRLKDIWDALPRWMDLRGRDDANNTEIMSVKQHNNFYYTHLPASSEAMAGNAGRGLTSPIFFVDEPPFQPNIQEALPAALAAGGKARELAAEAGAPHGTVITTTAGRKDTKEGAFMYSLLSEMAQWTEKFYDAKNQADLEQMIIANSRPAKKGNKIIRVNITLNHTQMGKDDEWLRKVISDSVATGDKADRDFFNRWTSGNATNPLSIPTLERIRSSEREPNWLDVAKVGGYITRWYLPESEYKARMASEPSLVILDTSEASGGDDISLRVVGMWSGQCFAAGTFNNTNIITFSEWVATWLTEWENTTMLIERKSTGGAVLDMLLLILPAKDIDPFKRIYNRIVNAPTEYKDLYEIASQPMWRRPSDFLELNKKYFGFPTSGSGAFSRAMIYGAVLSSAAKTVGHLVTDKITIDQITSLITKNGRVDHPPGEHDDMVMGWLLGHWFMTKATNLRFYGIDATQVLTQVREAVVLTPLEKLKQRQQAGMRERIKQLVEKIQETNDDAMLRIHEHEMRVIYSKLEMTENEKLTVDEVIAQAKEERMRRRIERTGTKNPASYNDQRHQQRADKMRSTPVTSLAPGNSPGRWGNSMTRWV